MKVRPSGGLATSYRTVSGMYSATALTYEVISGLSWRVEARAARMAPGPAQRLRDRAGRLLGWARAHRVLPPIEQRAAVLCFHGVAARPLDPDVECEILPVSEFRKLLGILHRSFAVISLTELLACIRENRTPPPRSVVITFDDGYANNCTVAAAELDRLGLPWSAFLPAALVEEGRWQWIDDARLLIHKGRRDGLELSWPDGRLKLELRTNDQRHAAVEQIHQLGRYVCDQTREDLLDSLYAQYPSGLLEGLRERFAASFAPLTWDQARQLKAAGVDLGSHSLTHTALAAQPEPAIRREVFLARDLIAQRLGAVGTHFSYPYGRAASINELTERALNEAGYDCAVTLEQDAVRCREVNPLRLPRLIVSPMIGRTVFNLWQRFCR